MTVLKFITKHINKILLLAAIVGVIFGIILCVRDGAVSYDKQKAILYGKEELFAGDMNKLKDMENTTVYVGEEKITVTFEEEYVKLITVYDKSGKLLSKEYEEKRLGGSFVNWFTTLGLCIIVSMSFLCILSIVLGFIVDFVIIVIEELVKQSIKNKET